LAAPGRIGIGISGWTYAPWRGVFYPQDLPHKKELPYAAGIFHSIEINGTFYSLQKPPSFAAWAEATPDDFMFTVKAPRFITHIRRLKECGGPLANFLASGLLRLGPKLGPILWQLPPNFTFQAERLEAFLQMLPHDTEAALAVARKRDKWMKDRTWLKTDAPRPLRHALEIRHASFAVPQFIELLRKHDVALVCGDSVEWPRLMDVTSDFFYCRLHGSEQLYASGYTPGALDDWAARVVAWARGSEPDDAERVIAQPAPRRASRDVFVFFDNDAKVRAPGDAQALMSRVDKILQGR
jgi:uncharacterized protein YecE (DUF72 family)